MNADIYLPDDVRPLLESIARDVLGGLVCTDYSDAEIVDILTR